MTGLFSPTIYGLLYLDDDDNPHANLRGGYDPIDVYIGCAALCASSLHYHNHRFKLVTNNKSRLEARTRVLRTAPFDVVEGNFSLGVPKNAKFFAAHFKLEVLRLLGTGNFGDEVGLIDIDTVTTSPIPFPSLVPGQLLAYDITAQILPEFGAHRVQNDIECVLGQPVKSCRWFGGEFLFGHARTFEILSNAITRIWARYIGHIKNLHHTSDETLISAVLAQNKLDVLDAGRLGLIARWWTARTGYRQVPFSDMKRRSVLHLPSDKPFLANLAKSDFDPTSFLRAFERHAASKLFRRRVFNLAHRTFRSERRFVASLT